MPIPVADPTSPFVGTFAYGETVTLLTPGTILDPYSGEASQAWELGDGEEWETEPVGQEVSQVGVEPRPSSEPVQDARNAVTSGYTLYLPSIEVSPQQKFIVRDETYDVLGEAAEWVNPFTGWAPGLVVQVGRTEG